MPPRSPTPQLMVQSRPTVQSGWTPPPLRQQPFPPCITLTHPAHDRAGGRGGGGRSSRVCNGRLALRCLALRCLTLHSLFVLRLFGMCRLALRCLALRHLTLHCLLVLRLFSLRCLALHRFLVLHLLSLRHSTVDFATTMTKGADPPGSNDTHMSNANIRGRTPMAMPTSPSPSCALSSPPLSSSHVTEHCVGRVHC